MPDLTWFGWALVLLWALNPFAAIGQIGEKREPITAGKAMFSVGFCTLLIVATLTVGVNG